MLSDEELDMLMINVKGRMNSVADHNASDTDLSMLLCHYFFCVTHSSWDLKEMARGNIDVKISLIVMRDIFTLMSKQDNATFASQKFSYFQ